MSQKNKKQGKAYKSLGQQHELLTGSNIWIKSYTDKLKEYFSKVSDNYNDYLQVPDVFEKLDLRLKTQGSFTHFTDLRTTYDKYFDIEVPVFTIQEFLDSPFQKLQDRIKELQALLKSQPCYEVLAEIKKTVEELRAMMLRRFSKNANYSRSIERTLTYGFKPNRQSLFRRLIQFAFKNMDDESGDAALQFAVVNNVCINSKKHHYHDGRQRRNINWTY
jgi:hypothetical protein